MLAFWLAGLVAIAPFADRGLIHGPGGSLAVQSATPHVDALAQSRDPVTAPRPNQVTVLGVLSRLLTGESKLGFPPGKTSVLGARQNEVVLALETATTSVAPPLSLPQRDVVEAAHPPTGPPA